MFTVRAEVILLKEDDAIIVTENQPRKALFYVWYPSVLVFEH